MLRTHLLICFVLVLIFIPVYLLDHYWLKSSGSNWISLDLSGLLIRLYLLLIAVHIIISTLAIFYFHHLSLLKTHIFSAIISFALIGIGFFLYNKVDDTNSHKKRDAITQQRKLYFNDIRLKQWWFMPDANNPKEIHVDLEIGSPGRLTANAMGNENGESVTNIFSSEGEVQREVKASETIEYVFSLTINHPGKAKDIQFTFYLFKHTFGESGIDDVAKIFKDTNDTNDDGTYFYQKLTPPLEQVPR